MEDGIMFELTYGEENKTVLVRLSCIALVFNPEEDVHEKTKIILTVGDRPVYVNETVEEIRAMMEKVVGMTEGGE